MFRLFRIFSQCSESVQTFSEFLAQKLVYSEFLDYVLSASFWLGMCTKVWVEQSIIQPLLYVLDDMFVLTSNW